MSRKRRPALSVRAEEGVTAECAYWYLHGQSALAAVGGVTLPTFSRATDSFTAFCIAAPLFSSWRARSPDPL